MAKTKKQKEIDRLTDIANRIYFRLKIMEKSKPIKWRDFAVLVSKKEEGKKQVNIAQISEILKIVNELTFGHLKKYVEKVGVNYE